MAKYLDNDGLLYLWQKIKNVFASKDALNDKVDKVTGKGLSTNDYTTDEKNKLNGIQAGAKSVSYTGSSAAAQTSTLVAVTVEEEGIVILHAENEEYIGVPTGEAALAAFNAKVDKQDGKGLSTEDYTTEEKSKLAALPTNDTLQATYATKSDITSMYKYQGSVATVSALPSSGNTTGDVYNVEATGMNYAWNGSAWDALGEIFTITSISNSEIDTIVAS